MKICYDEGYNNIMARMSENTMDSYVKGDFNSA